MTLQEKTKILKELRDVIDTKEKEFEQSIVEIKTQKDIIQQEILEEMKNTGQFSARFDFATVTRAVRKTTRITDENAVIDWLKENNLDKEYTEERVVILPHFDALAKQSVKEGKTIAGLEIKETEYISLTKAEEGKEKRKVVTE